MKNYKFNGYRDKNNKLIKEGHIVKIGTGEYRDDYSIVTKFNNDLIIFGRYLSQWVFYANKNFNSPYLEIVDKLKKI